MANIVPRRPKEGSLDGYVKEPRTPIEVDDWMLGEVPTESAIIIEKVSYSEVPPTSAESRFIVVDVPTALRPREKFAMHVQLTVNALEGALGKITPLPFPPEGRKLTIDLVRSENLELLDSSTVDFDVLPAADSPLMRFPMRAIREGNASILIRVFAGPQFVGAAEVRMVIYRDAATVMRTLHVAAEVAPSDDRSATLDIGLASDRQTYTFRVMGPDGFFGTPVPVQAYNVDELARGLQDSLNRLAKGIEKYEGAEVRAILEGLGSSLWAVVPATVREDLLAQHKKASRLLVLTSDPLPWELAYVSREAGGFLSEIFQVFRWRYGSGTPQNIGMGTPCYASAPEPPPTANDEIAAVRARMGEGKSVRKLAALLQELDAPTFGLLHFAAHNKPDYSRPMGSSVELDKKFPLAMMGPHRANSLSKQSPLVFMNACSSAVATLVFTGAAGWANAFLDAGAGGFIGSLWEVRDVTAARFAVKFYEELSRGKTLGDAFYDARDSIRSGEDPTWLAYTLYGAPLARYKGVALA